MYSFKVNQPASTKTQPLRNKGLLQARHIQQRLKENQKQESLLLPTSNEDPQSYFESIWY